MSAKKILEQHTPQEIVDSHVISEKLTIKQRKQEDLKLKEARKKVQAGLTDTDRLVLRLMQFKFQIEDYLNNEDFNPKFTFSYFLKEYVSLLNKKRRHFAAEINIDETELSQLINRHRFPNNSIIIRLEIHSNNSIPAVSWFRLVQKEKEHELMTSNQLRRQERKYVKNKLPVTLAQ